jgi:hypothetical protein
MITAPYQSSVQGHDGFGRLLLSEWVKLRSVPRWVLALLAAPLLTILIALLSSAGSQTAGAGGGGGGGAPPVSERWFQDGGELVPQPMAGDGSLVVQVTGQAASSPDAKAGLMIRESATRGSHYAAIVVTPAHGVRFLANFTTDIAGSRAKAPTWLKLTRTGGSVTGYESADGTAWTKVGSVKLREGAAVSGLFVASPDAVELKRMFGAEILSGHPTEGTATFAGTPWGTRTVQGSGDVGRDPMAEDEVKNTLGGIIIGMIPVIAVGVLFVTSEYRRSLIRLTLAATPRRGRVLAAKAVVLGAVTFVAGLVASVGTMIIAGPLMHSHHMDAGTLFEGIVLRSMLGTALLLAVIVVLSLGVATILRRSAPAITLVVLVLLLPQLLATGLPLTVAKWMGRLTPAAGFAAQQTVERYDTALGPWQGLGVLCGYAAVALGFAFWLLKRRDA